MSADRRPARRGTSRRPFDRFRAEPLERRELLTVQIAQPTYTLANTAQTAVVTLVRGQNPLVNPEIVQFGVTGGTARPDVDYTPVVQSVTFGSGEFTKQVSIPLLDAGHTDSRTIQLQVQTQDDQGNPAISQSTINLVGRSDIVPPFVQNAVQLRQGGRITGFQITFSEDMAAKPTANYKNYVVTGTLSKSGGFSLKNQTSTFNVPIKAASYDSSTHTVTLTTAKAYAPGTSYTITNPGYNGSSGSTSYLTDSSGNPLDSQGTGTADALLYAQADTYVKDTRGLSLPIASQAKTKKAATPAKGAKAATVHTAVVHKPAGPRQLAKK